MDLEAYRRLCGWSKSEMARQAGIDFNTLKRAIDGENVSTQTARSIAQTISRELGRAVHAQDIQGLNVRW